MRALHWVIKCCGNLKDTISFYSSVLGLKVLRHEEFEGGCEATCNGRFGGAWSKTMMGSTSETVDFCLELIYNWGIDSYSKGNCFNCLRIGDESGEKHERAKVWWAGKGKSFSDDTSSVEDPNGNVLDFVKDAKELFVCISLNVKDLVKSADLYCNGLHASVIGEIDSGRAGKKKMLRFGDAGTGVELCEIKEDIVQGSAQGRFATETSDGEPDRLAKRLDPSLIVHG